MANEADVLGAWLDICRGDTGAGSLVALTGKSEPAVPWGSSKAVNLPVLVIPIPPSFPTARTPYSREMTIRPEVRTPPQSGDLWARILDRLELVTTWSAFDAEGLDIQVTPRSRSPGERGEIEGYRIIAEYRLVVTI